MVTSGLIASIAVAAHAAAGGLALITGFVAFAVRKGSRLHRRIGTGFTASMTIVGIGAAILGLLNDDTNDFASGLMIVYLVTTATITAQRKDHSHGPVELVAGVLALAGTMWLFWLAGSAEFPVPAYLFSSIFLLAAIGDFRTARPGGLSTKQRLTRHVWRMGFALFIAAGSFFLGQMQLFPEPIRQWYVLAIPVLLVIAITVYWLVKLRNLKWFRGNPPRGGFRSSLFS